MALLKPMKPKEIASSEAISKFPVFVQPKLDGWRCLAEISKEHGARLFSATLRPLNSVPHINYVLNETGFIGILDGELIHPEGFQTTVSIVSRTRNIHQRYREVKLYVFDIQAQIPFRVRNDALNSLCTVFSEHVVRVPTYIARSCDEIEQYYRQFLEEGYEGIIIRFPDELYKPGKTNAILKMKPTKVMEVKVIGWLEEVDKYGEPKGRVGSLVCETPDGVVFQAGSGLTEQEKAVLTVDVANIKKYKAKIKYQELTRDGVPRFPRVMEVKRYER